MVITADNLTELWKLDLIRVSWFPQALACPACSRASQLWEPCMWSYHNVSLCLNISKCQQLLWMRTHKSWVDWKPVLDNSFALIHKEHWRGGGGAAEDRQLFKPAANPLQPLSHTEPPAFVQSDSKLLGIQELKYTKDIYTNTCQKSHFPSASWLFHGLQKGFHLAFTWQPLPPCIKILQLTLLQQVLKLCMATYISTHILCPPYWALGHRLSCQAKFHPKQFLNTHPINPPKRELVMEMLTETWRDRRATISV